MVEIAYCTYSKITGWRIGFIRHAMAARIKVVAIDSVKYLQIPILAEQNQQKLKYGRFCNPRQLIGV